MTLGIFFSPRVFCRLSSIMTVLKGKYSFFEKLVIHESAFLVFLIVFFFFFFFLTCVHFFLNLMKVTRDTHE